MPKNLLGNTPGNAMESALKTALGNALESSPAESPENEAGLPQDLHGQEHALKTLGANALDAARSSAFVSAGVHAGAGAQPVFLWGGEAWPGTLTDWEIQQAPDERVALNAADAGEAPQRSWSTRLALRLPEL
jgi:hypothetical protein